MKRVASLARALLFMLVAGVLGCHEDPTQIVVSVDTDFRLEDEIDTIGIEVFRKRGSELEERNDSKAPVTRATELPFTLALTSTKGGEPTVRVVVTGYQDKNPVIQRTAVVSFRTGKVLRLSMNLLRGCRYMWQQCESMSEEQDPALPDLTCDETGKCVSEVVTDLPPWNGKPDKIDETPTIDGGPQAPSDGGDADAMSTGDGDGDGPADGGKDAGDDVGPPKPNDLVEIALGDSHSCVRSYAGNVYCWGSNRAEELGRDNEAGCASITLDADAGTGYLACPNVEQVNGVEKAAALAAGEASSCARLESGQVFCWGGNGNGQLGRGLPISASALPLAVRRESGALQGQDLLHGGRQFLCARDQTTHKVNCWGDNRYEQLGMASVADEGSNVAVPALSGLEVSEFALGSYHGCAITGARKVHCWGRNDFAQVGADAVRPEQLFDTPLELTFDADLRTLDAGDAHSCVVRVDGVVECWGTADYGARGDGKTNTNGYPECTCGKNRTLLDMSSIPDATIKSVSLGEGFGCVLLELDGTGQVACWGHNQNGVTGQPQSIQAQYWPELLDLKGVRALASGLGHSCAIVQKPGESQIWCWGNNNYGQLGPTPTPALDAFSEKPQRVPFVP